MDTVNGDEIFAGYRVQGDRKLCSKVAPLRGTRAKREAQRRRKRRGRQEERKKGGTEKEK